MSYLTAYLFTRLDGIFITLKLIAIVSSSLAFTGFLGYILLRLNDEGVNAEKFKKHTKPFLIIAVITTLMALVTPTQKEIAFIYIAPKIANNTELKEAANRVPNIISLGIEYIEGQLKSENVALRRCPVPLEIIKK